jgi:hypothetical protein
MTGAGLSWSGWWDLNAPRRSFDPRPVAAATALLGELIEDFATFAGLVKAFAPDSFRAGRELLLMGQFPRDAVLGGKRLAVVVLT